MVAVIYVILSIFQFLPIQLQLQWSYLATVKQLYLLVYCMNVLYSLLKILTIILIIFIGNFDCFHNIIKRNYNFGIVFDGIIQGKQFGNQNENTRRCHNDIDFINNLVLDNEKIRWS